MARITSRDIFQGLDGQNFSDFKALQSAVLVEFNKHVLDFPPGYTYIDMLDRGFENEWIEEHRDHSYSVSINRSISGGATDKLAHAHAGA